MIDNNGIDDLRALVINIRNFEKYNIIHVLTVISQKWSYQFIMFFRNEKIGYFFQKNGF